MSLATIRSRRMLLDRLEARRAFVERHAAADPVRRRFPATNLRINRRDFLGNLIGYSQVSVQGMYALSHYDNMGRLMAEVVTYETGCSIVRGAGGTVIGFVRELPQTSRMVMLDSDGRETAQISLIDADHATLRDAEGRITANGWIQPGLATWQDANGRIMQTMECRDASGAFLALDGSWHLGLPIEAATPIYILDEATL